jgi:hypothetical protein
MRSDGKTRTLAKKKQQKTKAGKRERGEEMEDNQSNG